MSKLTMYDSKTDTLYIASKIILPDTKGMKFKDHCKVIDEAFKMDYYDRLNKYATEEQRASVIDELYKHPGCHISEFC